MRAPRSPDEAVRAALARLDALADSPELTTAAAQERLARALQEHEDGRHDHGDPKED